MFGCLCILWMIISSAGKHLWYVCFAPSLRRRSDPYRVADRIRLCARVCGCVFVTCMTCVCVRACVCECVRKYFIIFIIMTNYVDDDMSCNYNVPQ